MMESKGDNRTDGLSNGLILLKGRWSENMKRSINSEYIFYDLEVLEDQKMLK